MAVTSNVYTTTGKQARWGVFQQGKANVWTPTVQFFVLLCSTDVVKFQVAFDSTLGFASGTGPSYSYTGLLNQTPTTYKPVEIATGNGYTRGGTSLTDVYAEYSSGDLIMRAANTRWTATGAGFSAQSALLCYRQPAQFSPSWDYAGTYNAGATIYSDSYAVAMIDFGGTVTASAGVDFVLEWHPDGIMRWRLA
jgi:hypothetical protein